MLNSHRGLHLLIFAFLCLFGAEVADAQKIHRIGALIADDRFLPAFEGFKNGMEELGYAENRDVEYKLFNARRDQETLQKLSQKLLQLNPNLVLTSTTSATVPVAKVTARSKIPVVFLGAGDPLRLVNSYASSGNNLTGISASAIDLVEKRLELLTEIAPWVKRIASFNNPSGLNYQANLTAVRRAAQKLDLKVKEVDAANAEELERVTGTISRGIAGAILLPVDATLTRHMEIVVKQALREKLPLIPPAAIPLEKGGLATYGPDYFALGRQGASLADKIIRGSNPSDLPIEQPVKLNLAVNLKIAKAIGVSIPKSILLRADEIIQ